MAWGAVFAFLWRPVHRFTGRSRALSARPNLRAAISFALLLISLALPLVYAMQTIIVELSSFYDTTSAFVANVRESGLPWLKSMLPEELGGVLLPLFTDKSRIADFLASLAQSVAGFLQSISKGVIQWTGSVIFQSFIALTTMFFMIRDGEKVVSYVKGFIPLVDDDRERFVEKIGAMMNSVAYGVILTVGIQALLGGVAWWASGLPKVFLASAAMFLFGMFPLGASVVWAPGAIYLMATGSVGWGIGLFAWGAAVVSSIDNILRPVFIRGGASIPTLAVILGITGGIAAWGLLGVFLGPLSIAIFLSVLDMYRADFSERDKSSTGA
jgi:predicted PurR-regulated permease PerM